MSCLSNNPAAVERAFLVPVTGQSFAPTSTPWGAHFWREMIRVLFPQKTTNTIYYLFNDRAVSAEQLFRAMRALLLLPRPSNSFNQLAVDSAIRWRYATTFLFLLGPALRASSSQFPSSLWKLVLLRHLPLCLFVRYRFFSTSGYLDLERFIHMSATDIADSLCRGWLSVCVMRTNRPGIKWL